MPVGVRVPVSGEDHTRSLTPTTVRVLDPGEDHTWSITPVHVHVRVPVPGEGHMVAHSFVFQF